MSFVIKDSGERAKFSSGMVRDTTTGKIDYSRVLDGPMFERWAEHLSKGAIKYPDVRPGVANWTLANGPEEYERFRKSAFRHFLQWFRGDRDEDHASAVFFNINGAEYLVPILNRGEVQQVSEGNKQVQTGLGPSTDILDYF